MKKKKVAVVQTPIPNDINCSKLLLEILGHENVASREPIYECYDKNVQGRVLLERGQSNAGVIAPFDLEKFPKEIKDDCFSATLTHNPSIGKIDSYLVAQYALLEACARTVSVGSTAIAITDCLCFGNPEKPDQMWQFAQSCIAKKESCDQLRFDGLEN